jgi:hypothetical protein
MVIILRKIGMLIILTLSLLIGIWHFGFALKALFVFRQNESLILWIIILTGPLSTLPATIISFFWSRFGGIWLVCGGLVSFFASFFIEISDKLDYVIQYFVKFIGPMILLGSLAIIVRGRKVWPYDENKKQESYDRD